jgi:hypothetical protein
MVPFSGRLRICQLLDLDDSNLPLHQHRTAQMQHLSVDLAHQRRNDLATMSIRNDGRAGLDQLGACYHPPCAVQSHRKVMENHSKWTVLAYKSQDLLDLCSSWYVVRKNYGFADISLTGNSIFCHHRLHLRTSSRGSALESQDNHEDEDWCLLPHVTRFNRDSRRHRSSLLTRHQDGRLVVRLLHRRHLGEHGATPRYHRNKSRSQPHDLGLLHGQIDVNDVECSHHTVWDGQSFEQEHSTWLHEE